MRPAKRPSPKPSAPTRASAGASSAVGPVRAAGAVGGERKQRPHPHQQRPQDLTHLRFGRRDGAPGTYVAVAEHRAEAVAQLHLDRGSTVPHRGDRGRAAVQQPPIGVGQEKPRQAAAVRLGGAAMETTASASVGSGSPGATPPAESPAAGAEINRQALGVVRYRTFEFQCDRQLIPGVAIAPPGRCSGRVDGNVAIRIAVCASAGIAAQRALGAEHQAVGQPAQHVGAGDSSTRLPGAIEMGALHGEPRIEWVRRLLSEMPPGSSS